jgi:hypothetical protein
MPTVAHQTAVNRKIPMVFIPSGVSGSIGGRRRKTSNNIVPIAGPIHHLFFI